MIGINNFEEFLNQISKDLDLKIDSNTFDYDILKAIYLATNSIDSNIDQFLQSLDYENKSGRDLDQHMKMFNIYRRSGNPQDIYNFELAYNGDESILIKKDTIMKFENYIYKIAKDVTMISYEKNIIPAYKSYSLYEFKNPIFTENGDLIFEKSGIEMNDNINQAEFFPKFLKLVSYENIPGEQESDVSFLERSKNILSSMGYSNNKKIENILLSDSRIKSLHFENINGTTIITILPKIMNELDDIITYADEVIRYYQDCDIKLLKPNMIEIKVEGLKIQLMHISDYERLINIIKIKIKEYLSNSLIGNKLKRIDIISIISNTLKEYNVLDNIDYKIIKIKNNYYWHNNYESPILIEEIIDSLSIGENNIITLSDIQ